MAATDPRLIVLAPQDSVAVARCAIAEGETLDVAGQVVTLKQAVSMGHKLALKDMAPGEKVLKYGAPIGSVTAEIAVGDHVHLHNMKSDYTATYALNAEDEA